MRWNIAPDADEWAEKNQCLLDTLTRAGWQELDEGYKQSALRELRPEQMYGFWIEKFQQVMSDFKWNDKEVEHLEKMHAWLLEHPDMYKEKTEEDKKKLTVLPMNGCCTP